MDRAGLSKNLILLFASVLFSCFLIEIAFRFLLFGSDSFPIEAHPNAKAHKMYADRFHVYLNDME